MARLTIAQRREMQLETFNEKYIHNMELASELFNSYYRYVGLYGRLFEADNDERLYGTKYHKSLKTQEENWFKRLSKNLAPYGISIYVPWTIPFLGIKDELTGGITESVIDPILY